MYINVNHSETSLFLSAKLCKLLMIENKFLTIRRSKLSTENFNIDTLSSLYQEYLFTINTESHKHWKSMDTLLDAYSFYRCLQFLQMPTVFTVASTATMVEINVSFFRGFFALSISKSDVLSSFCWDCFVHVHDISILLFVLHYKSRPRWKCFAYSYIWFFFSLSQMAPFKNFLKLISLYFSYLPF